MDVAEKIVKALRSKLKDPYVRLDDEDGVSGFVVSPQFKGMSSLDRQDLIDNALREGPDPLTSAEQRRVLVIAGLTPLEFASLGVGIEVKQLREQPDGGVEVLVRGGLADVDYIRGAFKGQKSLRASEPEPSPGPREVLMSFVVRGTGAAPVTRAKVLRVLKADPYIRVPQDA